MEKLHEDNTAWRQALRREMLARRTSLGDGERTALSARIVTHALAALARPAIVGFCWPIKHEPDVRALVAQWEAEGTQAALPVVVDAGVALAFRAWRRESRLAPDRYGIPTPVDGAWLVPDLLLLPLNGFDAAGYRLGYGGGFFDRTLAEMRPKPLAVGVGFEINRLETIRPEPHDQRLDWIVTENGAFRPGA